MRIVICLAKGFLNLIYSFIKLHHTKARVVIISRQADNPTEDIGLLSDRLTAKGIEVTCLCRTLGKGKLAKLSYIPHMFTQMYYLATSSVAILDSYCICASNLRHKNSLTIIQMWHALGSLKRFGYSIVGESEGSSAGLAEAMNMHQGYDYILTSSETCLPNFAQAFGYENKQSVMRVMSLPRVDKLTDKKLMAETKERILKRYPEIKEKKLVVYAPTFRKGKDISKEIEALAKEFSENEYVFILKKHPLMETNCESVLEDCEFTTIEMLYAADCVICDYSAIIYEAAIIGKPMFFYTFDYDSYGVDRSFYIDYKKEMPGLISDEPKELAKAIKLESYDLNAINAFGKRYVQNQANCTECLADFVISMM